jgi:hypothetical protein
MATLTDIKPVFGPQVADDATVLLPPLPAGLTSELEVAITQYRSAFFSQDDDGEASAERMCSAAHQIAEMPMTAHADIAAKLIIGLHESHPSLIGDQLALDASSFETDASGRILLSVVHDLLRLASPPTQDDEWQALINAQRVAHAATIVRGLDDDEVHSRCNVEDEILYRLIDVPTRSLAEFVQKLGIVLAWSYSPARDVMAKVLADGQRLVSIESADRSTWEAAEAEYRKAWALWDDLGDVYTNEESDAVAAIAFPAMERMMDIPAPDAAAMLMKMIAAREGNRIVNEDDMDALIQDARRFAAFDGNLAAKDQHVGWLTERNALIEYLDSDVPTEDEANERVGHLNELDRRIITTPASTMAAVFSKLLLAVQLTTEGQELVESDAATFVREANAVTGMGRVSPNVASKREA